LRIFYEGSQTQENTFAGLLYKKSMTKYYRYKLDEEVQKARPGNVLSTGALSFGAWVGHAPAIWCGCVHQTGGSPDPMLSGSFWRLHHVGMIDYELNPHPSPLPGSQEIRLKAPCF
jgi:hypothetical protein